jgi:hypothetical protein
MALPASVVGSTQITGRSGQVYTPNARGQIVVTNSTDVSAFHASGFLTVPASSDAGRVPLTGFRNTDGSALAAAAAAGKFGQTITLGTAHALVGEAATGATKTDAAIYEFVLPTTYVAGLPLTATVHAAYAGTGTAGTATVAIAAYLDADAGTEGSNLVSTAAQTVTATDAGYSFTIAGGTLTPGARVMLKVTGVMQETGGSASLTLSVNSVSVQYPCRFQRRQFRRRRRSVGHQIDGGRRDPPGAS